jgi:hypothetical protein
MDQVSALEHNVPLHSHFDSTFNEEAMQYNIRTEYCTENNNINQITKSRESSTKDLELIFNRTKLLKGREYVKAKNSFFQEPKTTEQLFAMVPLDKKLSKSEYNHQATSIIYQLMIVRMSISTKIEAA